MQLTILGFNSALPTANSASTAQILNVNDRLYLVDCGEGTQVQMRRAKVKFSKLDAIFISHLHGDHVFGLVGLLNSLQLLGRQKEMHIVGPKGIREFVEVQLKLSNAINCFELVFTELEGDSVRTVYQDKHIRVENIPLDHRIYTNGYLFEEQPKRRKLRMSKVGEIPEIEVCDYDGLKDGRDFVLQDGTTIPNEALTQAPASPKRYAFCSDTRYLQNLWKQIRGVDLLYHEATFLHEDKALATKTGHSTALEAAKVAEQAQAKCLIIGHFSNRYKSYKDLQEEAQTLFPNTLLPKQLETYTIGEELGVLSVM